MSDDPLLSTIRDAYAPGSLDAATFSAALHRRRRNVVLAGGGVALVGVAAAFWLVTPGEVAVAPAPPVLVVAPPPETPDVEVSGIARAIDGSPLVGASVTAGGATATTDASGRFSLRGHADDTVRIDKAGFTTTWARIHPDQPVDAFGLPIGFSGTLSGEAGGTLVGADGMTLTLPPRGVKDAAGRVVEGDIGVRWTLLRRPEHLEAAPGDLVTVVGGAEVPLQSFGMVEVVLTGEDGAELDLIADAEIGVPLVDGHPFREGQDVGLYAFDEDTGIWNSEGHGVVRDGKMVASVGHFSWWNCDEPLSNTGCVCGNVRIANLLDEKLPVIVRAIGQRTMTSSRTRAAEDGGYCVNAMPDVAVKLRVWQPFGKSCLLGESDAIVTSRAGTSVEADASQCARADVVAEVIDCSAPATANYRMRAPEIDTILIDAAPPPPPANQLHLRVWTPELKSPYTDMFWRCGAAEWAGWPIEADQLVRSMPVEAGQKCQVRFWKGTPFLFVTKAGTTSVVCNYLSGGSACRLSDGPVAAMYADLLHVTVWSAEGTVPLTTVDVRCGQDLEFELWQKADLIGGGAYVPIEPDLPCELVPGGAGGRNPVFKFTGRPGTTEVFCDVRDEVGGCRLGAPTAAAPR